MEVEVCRKAVALGSVIHTICLGDTDGINKVVHSTYDTKNDDMGTSDEHIRNPPPHRSAPRPSQ